MRRDQFSPTFGLTILSSPIMRSGHLGDDSSEKDNNDNGYHGMIGILPIQFLALAAKY